MIDRKGKSVTIGNYVKFWHLRGRELAWDIGIIIGFDDNMVKIKFMVNPQLSDFCFRTKNGITLLSNGEAMLAFLEKAE